MNEEEFRAIKATFPWRKRLLTAPHRQGGIVQVIDNAGNEVPLFTMVGFLEFITARNTQPAQAPTQAPTQA